MRNELCQTITGQSREKQRLEVQTKRHEGNSLMVNRLSGKVYVVRGNWELAIQRADLSVKKIIF